MEETEDGAGVPSSAWYLINSESEGETGRTSSIHDPTEQCPLPARSHASSKGTLLPSLIFFVMISIWNAMMRCRKWYLKIIYIILLITKYRKLLLLCSETTYFPMSATPDSGVCGKVCSGLTFVIGASIVIE